MKNRLILAVVALACLGAFSLPISASVMKEKQEQSTNLLLDEEESVASEMNVPELPTDQGREENKGWFSSIIREGSMYLTGNTVDDYVDSLTFLRIVKFQTKSVVLVGALFVGTCMRIQKGVASLIDSVSPKSSAIVKSVATLLAAAAATAFGGAGAGAAAYLAFKYLAPYVGYKNAAALGFILFFFLYYFGLSILNHVFERYAGKKRKAKDEEEREKLTQVDVLEDSKKAWNWVTNEGTRPKEKKQFKSEGWGVGTWIGLTFIVLPFIPLLRALFIAAYAEPLQGQKQRSEDSDAIELQFIDDEDRSNRSRVEQYMQLALEDRARANYNMQTAMLEHDVRQVKDESNGIKIDMELLRRSLTEKDRNDLLKDKEQVDTYHKALDYLREEEDENNQKK